MAKRLFAIGDIHGCFIKLKDLIETQIKISDNDIFVLLGDYIDRGNQSKEVIDYILHLKERNQNIIPLLGNHEKMLLDALSNTQNLSKWIANGGTATLNSFGIKDLSQLNPIYLNFFDSLEYYYSYRDHLFVHAGFNDEIADPFSDHYHMIWKCRNNYRSSTLSSEIIVHGHCPISVDKCHEQILNNSSVINLDTGCVYTDKVGFGQLSAIEINSRIVYSI